MALASERGRLVQSSQVTAGLALRPGTTRVPTREGPEPQLPAVSCPIRVGLQELRELQEQPVVSQEPVLRQVVPQVLLQAWA